MHPGKSLVPRLEVWAGVIAAGLGVLTACQADNVTLGEYALAIGGGGAAEGGTGGHGTAGGGVAGGGAAGVAGEVLAGSAPVSAGMAGTETGGSAGLSGSPSGGTAGGGMGLGGSAGNPEAGQGAQAGQGYFYTCQSGYCPPFVPCASVLFCDAPDEGSGGPVGTICLGAKGRCIPDDIDLACRRAAAAECPNGLVEPHHSDI